MAKAIHMMIRVLDEDRSIAFYRDALGLDQIERLEFDSFTLVYLRNDEADFEVELTVNHDQTEPYDPGEAYGHLAVSVDDLDAEHARQQRLGFAPKDIVEFHRDDALFARFFFMQDPDGYKIEFLQRHGRFN